MFLVFPTCGAARSEAITPATPGGRVPNWTRGAGRFRSRTRIGRRRSGSESVWVSFRLMFKDGTDDQTHAGDARAGAADAPTAPPGAPELEERGPQTWREMADQADRLRRSRSTGYWSNARLLRPGFIEGSSSPVRGRAWARPSSCCGFISQRKRRCRRVEPGPLTRTS